MLVSVLISLKPTERPDYLDAALRSLQAQTRPADEIVLVQDGPARSGLVAVIDAYRRDLPIRDLVLERNVGLGAALALGLELCRGDLVARCDTDDISLPDRFARQIEVFAADPDLAILGGYAQEFASDGTFGALRRVPLTHEQIIRALAANPLVHPAVMFRRDAILDVGSYSPELRRAQDYELWFRCAANGLKFRNLPEILVQYRFVDQDVTKRSSADYWQQGRIGLAGCRMLGQSWAAQLSCFVPFLRSLLPRSVQPYAFGLMRRFDPRHRHWPE